MTSRPMTSSPQSLLSEGATYRCVKMTEVPFTITKSRQSRHRLVTHTPRCREEYCDRGTTAGAGQRAPLYDGPTMLPGRRCVGALLLAAAVVLAALAVGLADASGGVRTGATLAAAD